MFLGGPAKLVNRRRPLCSIISVHIELSEVEPIYGLFSLEVRSTNITHDRETTRIIAIAVTIRRTVSEVFCFVAIR